MRKRNNLNFNFNERLTEILQENVNSNVKAIHAINEWMEENPESQKFQHDGMKKIEEVIVKFKDRELKLAIKKYRSNIRNGKGEYVPLYFVTLDGMTVSTHSHDYIETEMILLAVKDTIQILNGMFS